MSYFYAYLSQRPVKFDEVAVTFISTRRPQKLLKILQSERKYKIIASNQPGIYYITTDAPSLPYVPAMQLVVSNELSAKDAEWIKAIRDDWTVEFGAEVLEKTEKMNDSQLRDVAFSLLWANYHNWKEETMRLQGKNFKKWLVTSGLTEEIQQEAWQGGRQEGRQEGQQEGWQKGIEEERKKNAKAMKDEGIDINTIAKITGMKPASIRRL
jgi:predicted transposase/invertase (TIGR01784 family)